MTVRRGRHKMIFAMHDILLDWLVSLTSLNELQIVSFCAGALITACIGLAAALGDMLKARTIAYSETIPQQLPLVRGNWETKPLPTKVPTVVIRPPITKMPDKLENHQCSVCGKHRKQGERGRWEWVRAKGNSVATFYHKDCWRKNVRKRCMRCGSVVSYDSMTRNQTVCTACEVERA